MTMSLRRNACFRFAFLVLALTWCASASSQEPGKEKDDALDSLIEKLAGPEKLDQTAKEGKGATEKKPGQGGKEARADQSQPAKPSGGKPGSGDVSSKDKELDELLEK